MKSVLLFVKDGVRLAGLLMVGITVLYAVAGLIAASGISIWSLISGKNRFKLLHNEFFDGLYGRLPYEVSETDPFAAPAPVADEEIRSAA